LLFCLLLLVFDRLLDLEFDVDRVRLRDLLLLRARLGDLELDRDRLRLLLLLPERDRLRLFLPFASSLSVSDINIVWRSSPPLVPVMTWLMVLLWNWVKLVLLSQAGGFSVPAVSVSSSTE